MPIVQRLGSASARGFGFGKSGVLYERTIAETATGVDSVTWLNTVSSDISETSTVTDATAAILNAIGQVIESATATDQVNTLPILSGVIAETSTGTDVSTNIGTFGRTVAETSTGTDVATNIGTFGRAIDETATGVDAPSINQTFNATLAEVATGADSPNATRSTFGTISEIVIGIDEVNRQLLASGAVNETAIGIDTILTTANLNISVSEVATVSDSPVGVLNYWIASLSEPNNNTTSINSSAIDSSGNIYITGQGDTTSIANGVLVAKYNNLGVMQWVRILETVSITEYGTAIQVDSVGNIYITAVINSASTSSTRYSALIKYDNNGNLLFQSYYRVPSFYTPMTPRDLVIFDGDLYIYTTGQYGSTTSSDVYFCEHLSDGTISFLNTASGGYDYGRAIIVDHTANLLIAGSIGVVNGGFTDEIAGIIRYDTTGTYINSFSFANVTATQDSRFYDVAKDSNDNYYCCGVADYAVGAYNYMMLVKLDSSFAVQWIKGLYYSSGGSSDLFTKITIDADNSIYILGLRSTGSTYDRTTIFKYDVSGNLLWQRYIALTSSSVDLVPGNISVDALSMYVTCATSSVSFTLKLPKDGTLTGTYTVGGRTIVYGTETLTETTLVYTWNSRSPTRVTQTPNQTAGGATSFTPTETEALTYI